MKKTFFSVVLISLMAAACHSKTSQTSTQTTTDTKPTPTVAAVPSTQKPSPTPTPKPAAKTSDLKTYSNSEYGFEFQYPYKTLQVKDCASINLKYPNVVYKQCMYVVPPSELAPSHDGVIAVFNSNMSDTMKAVGSGGASAVVSIHGVDWTLLVRPDGLADYLTNINGKTLWLIYAQTVKQSDFDQIIATFKIKK